MIQGFLNFLQKVYDWEQNITRCKTKDCNSTNFIKICRKCGAELGD